MFFLFVFNDLNVDRFTTDDNVVFIEVHILKEYGSFQRNTSSFLTYKVERQIFKVACYRYYILPDTLPLENLLIDDGPKKRAAGGRGGRGGRGGSSRGNPRMGGAPRGRGRGRGGPRGGRVGGPRR